ncbi:MAG: helicase, partial [Lentisphaeria bacterium]|nr:helicase [Lentisphaeria bacterium]
RSLKVVLLRAGLALLSAGQRAWELNPANGVNPADPYMTLLGYFGSLRELGGSRRIIEDEVKTRLAEYRRRRRQEPEDRTFTSRKISYEVVELTSRVTTDKVAEAKRRLAMPFSDEESVDVALATNMISVGLDIMRLGLMVVLGQPKTSSEYIQATSRVGRDSGKPGLVVTLMNIHRPRDRSHYERFSAYHRSFYRHVEATSVTPFSPRALDRALPGALVSLCRQMLPEMTPPAGAQEIVPKRTELDLAAEAFALRAQDHHADMSSVDRQALYTNVLHRCRDLLDAWLSIAENASQEGSSIQYQKEQSTPNRRLLYGFLDPELATIEPLRRRFRANRSMRDVESGVDVEVRDLNAWGDNR